MKTALFSAALLSAASLAGCSVIVGGSVDDSCENDADCSAIGFVGATCNLEKKICEPGGGAAACETADDCEAQNGGNPSICRADKTCAQLTSTDCGEVFGDYKDPNAIVLGFLGPLVGSDASTGLPIRNGAKLALNEFKNSGNLPSVSGGGPRPIAMVFCHDLDAPEDDPYRAAKHLVNDVKVPAILGPAFSGVTINTAKQVTVPGGVLTISASATSPLITDLDDNGLVWRTCPSDALQAIPLAQLVGPLETQIRTEQSLMASDQIRVAMTVKGDAYGTGLADAVTPQLMFNGKDAVANGDNFKRVDYDDPNSNPNVDFSAVVADVIAHKPHLVLLFGTTETAQILFDGIEAAWGDITPAIPRPYYLLPDGGKVIELLQKIGDDDDKRKRVRGTVPGVAGALYDSFKLRYKAFIKEDPLAFADTGYDATYLLAYSIVSQGDKTITGTTIADGLKKTIKGSPINAGPSDINKAFQSLTSTGEIDYTGASGPLNFDTATGEAKADIDIWCVGRNANNEAIFVSSGQRYDAAQGKVVGTYNDAGQCN
ncbi:MAG: ABC transporter substrate-binding protein [Polyangiaceae bacterium]|nr:ABC transporter substrate-binding protein [Polyangiaceae bacterium]